MKFSVSPRAIAPVTIAALALATAMLVAIAPGWAQAADTSTDRRAVERLPLNQNGGTWDAGHVQGVAVDVEGGFIYYSFTNLLAKYDLEGRLVGTLVGWTGHLGDLALNPVDGRLYGSLEYKADEAFYIAVIDVAGLNEVGVEASRSDLFRTVHLAEVGRDYAADMDGDGRFDGDTADTRDHRYGASGIDGVAFGPRFGRRDGPVLLTVAYGVYGDVTRADNDHQVLLQYDIAAWDRYARPLSEAAPHREGPAAVDGKYFVRTGNTTYGVQNLAYDAEAGRWFMGVYQGRKLEFPNYLLFAVDAEARPARGDLIGVPAASGQGWEQGMLLPLAPDGLEDPATGLRGWRWKADVGFQPLGRGLFYVAANSGGKGAQTADIALMRWTGDPQTPFAPVDAEERLRRLSAP
ncbi:MAG: hypothetical protein LKF80_13495 [Brevundimonas sp.]|jgi:hypothetical protein|uniref:hypothetical protein n=1 Tax=Brevundimonas sp. TaxID=1871086 RepID=UPI0025C3E02D|nr:hypothetical protein [Brevundimonas sp.]MCH4269411.1 hypothetical protein [Brevundimonas sp.]